MIRTGLSPAAPTKASDDQLETIREIVNDSEARVRDFFHDLRENPPPHASTPPRPKRPPKEP